MKIKSKINLHIPQGSGLLILEENQIYECEIVKDSPVEPYLRFKDGIASISLLNESYIEVLK